MRRDSPPVRGAAEPASPPPLPVSARGSVLTSTLVDVDEPEDDRSGVTAGADASGLGFCADVDDDELDDAPGALSAAWVSVDGVEGCWVAVGDGDAFGVSSALGRLVAELALHDESPAGFDLAPFRLDREAMRRREPRGGALARTD